MTEGPRCLESEKRGKKKGEKKNREKKTLPDFNSLHPYSWAREVSDSLKKKWGGGGGGGGGRGGGWGIHAKFQSSLKVDIVQL